MTPMSTDDVMTMLRHYAPEPDRLAAEWAPNRVRDTIVATGAGDSVDPRPAVMIPVRNAPTQPLLARWRRRLPVAASVAVLATAGVVIAISTAGGGRRIEPGGVGPAFVPPAGLSDVALAVGQYSHRVIDQIALDARGAVIGHAENSMVDSNYVDTDGGILSFRTGSQNGCFRFSSRPPASFSAPSKQFLADLPTDVDRLQTYLRSHVEGSSSLDEAVFVAVSDALRTADALASPKLRAAMLGVLSRTSGVLLHDGQTDQRGRPAIRADFIDGAIRPGEVHSLYFDPVTFQLLEERFSFVGPSGTPAPSPAYTAHAQPPPHPVQLDGSRAFVTVVTSETVVDHLPDIPPGCGQ